MDVEWTPARVKGQQQNPVALLQLADKHIIILVGVLFSTFNHSFHLISFFLPLADPRLGDSKECREAAYATH
jgi:hypothetical protein